jgi:Flp pilus assembly protein TadD
MLLRAKILDSSGQHSEADKAIDESMHLVISRPQLAQESALLLARHQQGGKALSVIGQALKSAPDNPDLMLARVIVLASLNRTNDAEKGVKELEGRWPEWDRPYVIEGHLLEREGRVDEAQRRIGIAIALGTRDPAAICAQTRMAASGTTSNECLCQQSFLLPLLSDCQK